MKQSKTLSAVGSTALLGVEACGLHRKTPYGMTKVSMTQLSIARFYGGIKFNGEEYTYLPRTDELIRNDVLKWQRKQKRAAKTPNESSSATPPRGPVSAPDVLERSEDVERGSSGAHD